MPGWSITWQMQPQPAMAFREVGGLNKIGPGTLTMTGPNTYQGPTKIAAGIVSLGVVTSAMQLNFNGNSTDSSANNNNATLVNGPIYTHGNQGQALTLNGSSQYAAVPYSPSLGLAGSFTVSLWESGTLVNGAVGSSGPALISTRNGGEDSFDIQVTSGGLHGDIGNGSGWLSTSANATASLGSSWNMITYAVSPSAYQIYVDGQLSGSGSISGTPVLMKPGETFSIGAQEAGGGSYGASGYFNGSIEEVNVYNSALSARKWRSSTAIRIGCFPVRQPFTLRVLRHSASLASASWWDRSATRRPATPARSSMGSPEPA